MDKAERIEKMFKKHIAESRRKPTCRICDREIKEDDLWECEHIENRRGASYFAHRVCIQCGGYQK